MDHDPERKIPPELPEAPRYLAIDTNVLVSHLRTVRALHAAACGVDRWAGMGEGSPSLSQVGALLVPSIVIHELDKLNSSTKLVRPDPEMESCVNGEVMDPVETVGTAARRATAWLLSITRAQRRQLNSLPEASSLHPPRLRCQAWAERLDSSLVKPDDRVLDCCLYFSSRPVTLWTDDVNLCLLAESNSVPTISTRGSKAFESLARALGLEEFTLPPVGQKHGGDVEMEIDLDGEIDIDRDVEMEAYDVGRGYAGYEEEDGMELDRDLVYTEVNDDRPVQDSFTHSTTTLTTTTATIPTTTTDAIHTLLLTLPIQSTPQPSLLSLLHSLQTLPTASTASIVRAQARIATAARTVLLFLQSRHVVGGLRGDRGARRIRSGEAADAWRVVKEMSKVVGWTVDERWDEVEKEIRNLP